MKFLNFIGVCCCMLLSGLSMAQQITVVEASTQNPMFLVSVSSSSQNRAVTTNEKGQADISAFEGVDDILISFVGYEPVLLSFDQLRSQQFQVALNASSITLDQFVVSATRWQQSTSNVPAKIVSVSPRQVALQNPQTAADLLQSSGNVYIQKSQQGGGSPMIRGFSTNRLLYTVDGVRMNTAIFRGGNIQNVISLDPFAIEHTEILFGPGSVIYGSDAIGGVMSFKTLTPQLSDSDNPLISGKATARYSSANNEKTSHFDVNIGWKKWALATSFSAFDFDHLRQGSHGPDEYIKPYYVQRQDSTDVVITQEDSLLQIPTAYSQMNLMQKIRFKPNDEWDFQYGFHYSETSPYGRYDRHNRVRDGLPRHAEWNYGPQIWMMNNLNIRHSGNNVLYDDMTIRLAHQYFEESRVDRSLNDNIRAIREEQVQAYSANVDFNISTGSRNTVYYGVEFIQNDVLSSGTDKNIDSGIAVAGPSRYPGATWQSLGIYINDEFRISKKISLQGGLRYNQFILDAQFDTTYYPLPFTEANLNNGALTGSAGAVYRPNSKWAIKANFGTAFRSPNVDDIGKIFDSEPGSVVVPNPDLTAEYAYNIDFGIAKIFGQHVKIDFSGYYTILQNALVRRNFTLNGQDSVMYDGILSRVTAIQNAAIARVWGIQAGFEVKLSQGFGISGDINYQEGEEELADGSTSASRHAAPLFGNLRLTYAYNNLEIQLYTLFQGERAHDDLAFEEQAKTEIYARDKNGNTYAPAWYTLNLKARYKFNYHFAVAAGVENITDQRYRTYSSGISAPGRNFILSATAKF